MNFKLYWMKYCPMSKREDARKMWNMYLETSKVSTDMNSDMICYNTADTAPPMVSWAIARSFAPSTPQVCNAVPCAKSTKGNNPMYVDNDKHIESSKINYLNDRIQTTTYVKRNALQKQFGLVNDAPPDTAQKLLDRIKSGKFVIASDKLNKRSYEPTQYIEWRDPAIVKDEAGMALAETAMDEQTKAVYDLIAIDTPANALAGIKAFEAWTYTAPVTSA